MQRTTTELPLLHAAHNAYEIQTSDIFRLLLAYGADITARTEFGYTVLMEVLNYSGAKLKIMMDMINALIDKGANPLDTRPDGSTALALAACGDAPEVVNLLIDKGDNVNRRDEESRTPLLWACCRAGSVSVVKALLDRGADIKVKDKDDQSALAMASESGRMEIVSLLLTGGSRS